jgi:glutamyl-tRNA synthetase
VLAYREEGYLPGALLNYLARLGWSHGDQEIFSLEEMTALFDIADVNKSASAINPDKLAWINQQHLMRLPPAKIVPELRWQLERLGIKDAGDATLEAVILAQRERSKTLKEMAEASRFFFQAPAAYDEKSARKYLTSESAAVLALARTNFETLADWTAPAIHALIQAQAEASGLSLGKIAQPLRVAVSGGSVSPPIDQTLAILGRVQTVSRIDRAIKFAHPNM